MEKNQVSKKIKLVIILAISLVALFLIISIFQIVAIHNKKDRLKAQQEEINSLHNQREYYDNYINNDNKDDYYEITAGEQYDYIINR